MLHVVLMRMSVCERERLKFLCMHVCTCVFLWVHGNRSVIIGSVYGHRTPAEIADTSLLLASHSKATFPHHVTSPSARISAPTMRTTSPHNIHGHRRSPRSALPAPAHLDAHSTPEEIVDPRFE